MLLYISNSNGDCLPESNPCTFQEAVRLPSNGKIKQFNILSSIELDSHYFYSEVCFLNF
jgi:hypothetical protein